MPCRIVTEPEVSDTRQPSDCATALLLADISNAAVIAVAKRFDIPFVP
jgi:hypothetical protein